MQKLKDLIQALMEAFISFKRAFISNQAMPGDTDVIVSANPSSTNPVRFVAPSDGYVYVSDRGVNNQVSSLEINHADFGPFGTRSFGDGNSISRLIFPVKKGRSVDINISNTALTDIVCRFRATIGGGLNTILQSGGVLCLRLKTIFARGACVSVRQKQKDTSLTQFLNARLRTLYLRTILPPSTVLLTSPLGTSMRLLSKIRRYKELQRHSAPAKFGVVAQKTPIFATLFLSVRGTTSKLVSGSSRVKTPLDQLTFSRGAAQANLCLKGGAL